MSSLKKAAIRGSIWIFTGSGIEQLLRLARNIILTRLLVPEMFGIMALVSTFTLGLKLFSDIGIQPGIIQNKRGDEPDFLNTAWTIQVIRGFLLWFGCLIIAWPVARFYNEPSLTWLLPVVGLTTIIDGFNSTALITLNRDLSLGKLTLLEAAVQFITMIVVIAWALISPTIWALVAGSIFSSLMKMAWSHHLIPGYENRFRWDKTASQDLFSFGKWIFITTAMTFLAGQSDKLILGKLLSLKMLGIYTIAFHLSIIPQRLIRQLSMKIVFPVISRFSALPREKLREKISRKRLLILLCLVNLVAVLVGFGDLIIKFLYDVRYIDASWMLVILSFGLWPRILVFTLSPALLAIGKPYYAAWGNCLKLVYIFIFLPFGFFLMGPLGAIIVISLYDIPLYLVVCLGLKHEGLLYFRQDVLTSLLLIGLIIVLCAVRGFFEMGLPISALLN